MIIPKFPLIGSTFSKHYKKWYMGLVLAFLIAILVVFLQRFSFMQILEAKTLDARFATNTFPETASKDIILVGIDDSSLKYFADNDISWPWPRNFYAHLLDYLTESGAKSVIFDILFYQPDIDRSESEGSETDKERSCDSCMPTHSRFPPFPFRFFEILSQFKQNGSHDFKPI